MGTGKRGSLRRQGSEVDCDDNGDYYYDANIPHLFRWRGSVIPNTIFQTLIVTAFAAAVTVIYMKTDIKPGIPQTFIPVLGFVVGLLLTYRTNTAYDRYWEGRRTWSSMVTAIRNITRYIWVGVRRKKSDEEKAEEQENLKIKYLKIKRNKNFDPKTPKTEEEIKKEEEEKILIERALEVEEEAIKKKREASKKTEEQIRVEKILRKIEEEEIKIEKTTAIRLLIGFAFAVKHYLREEEGNECKDIKPFISDIKSNLPGFADLREQDAAEKSAAQDRAQSKKKDKEQSNDRMCWSFRILNLFSNEKKPHQREDKEGGIRTNHNLPLEISLYIADYITTQTRKERITVPLANNLLVCVNTLIDCLSSFERILRSPIPLAYSIHLTQTVWVYCLSLPFQLVAFVGWSTIVIVFFATFILLGIERIAAEIENPFGYDPNDLKLGDFCRIIERELKLIINHDPPHLDNWVFNKDNIDALQRKDSYIDSLYPENKKEVRFDESAMDSSAMDSLYTNHKRSDSEIAIEVDDKVDKVSR